MGGKIGARQKQKRAEKVPLLGPGTD